MTDLASRIVSALFDQIETDQGLVKSRAVKRVREIIAASEAEVEVKPAPKVKAKPRAVAPVENPLTKPITDAERQMISHAYYRIFVSAEDTRRRQNSLMGIVPEWMR